jgi:hypothetical protein
MVLMRRIEEEEVISGSLLVVKRELLLVSKLKFDTTKNSSLSNRVPPTYSQTELYIIISSQMNDTTLDSLPLLISYHIL